MLLAIFAGKFVLTLVFGPEFAAAESLLVIVAVALCARLFGVIPQSLLHAQRRFKTFLFREIAAVIVCVGFLAICVPLWGLMGAGYAILAAALFRLLIMWVAAAMLRWPRRARSDRVPAADGGGAV